MPSQAGARVRAPYALPRGIGPIHKRVNGLVAEISTQNGNKSSDVQCQLFDLFCRFV